VWGGVHSSTSQLNLSRYRHCNHSLYPTHSAHVDPNSGRVPGCGKRELLPAADEVVVRAVARGERGGEDKGGEGEGREVQVGPQVDPGLTALGVSACC